MISKKLESIKDGVAAVNTAVETPALLYFNKKALDDALQEKGQLAMKFADTFALRQVVAGSILAVKGTEISESNMILQDRCDRFRNGSIDGRPILLEMFGYDPTPETGEPQELLQLYSRNGISRRELGGKRVGRGGKERTASQRVLCPAAISEGYCG